MCFNYNNGSISEDDIVNIKLYCYCNFEIKKDHLTWIFRDQSIDNNLLSSHKKLFKLAFGLKMAKKSVSKYGHTCLI